MNIMKVHKNIFTFSLSTLLRKMIIMFLETIAYDFYLQYIKYNMQQFPDAL